ncbi:MAG: S1/P1 nuclease [Muribaculaceae bacterium]|nr:S1/P1 nuclease [Muribaculaceae bacterium]
MRKTILTLGIFSFITLNAFGWGQKGHDTVAFIAENHLTPTTQAAIDSLLDGYSLVYWANWLDNASHTADYAYTKTWHYKNIDANKTFENAPKIKEGNIVDAITEQVAVLQDENSTKDEKALALKMVVHFLGDIHQPMHMGRASDRGGNYHKVKFFKRDTNLHSVWDSNVLETAHKWSHTEWQREIDRLSAEQQAELVKGGTPATWGKETYLICTEIYENTPESTNIEYDYVAKWTPTVELQLEKGGLRLADVLNSVFDPEYEALNSFTSTK